MSHLTETFIFKDLYKVRWTRLGDNASPSVILVHGFPFPSLEWLPFAQALNKEYSVYLWGFPGFGASLETAFSRLESSAFASLCLLNDLAITPWGSPFLRAVMKDPEVFEAVPTAMFEGLLREYVQLAAWKELNEATLNEFVGPWTGDRGKRRFLDQIRQFDQKHTEEVEGKYAQVMANVDGGPKKLKILWAENDNLIPIRKGEKLAEVTGAREFVRIVEAGHLVMVDQAKVVMYEIAKWLEQKEGEKKV